MRNTMGLKNPNSGKVILDLCGGTGSWAKPYKDAGYTVYTITLPEFDITKTRIINERQGKNIIVFSKGENSTRDYYIKMDAVYGILAAPPCTMFSMARTNAKTPRDLKGAMETVNACIQIIQACQYNGKRLAFWALENPKARLRWFLGKPSFTFNPYDFGDRYRKPTDLWGYFNEPKKNPVTLTGDELTRMGNNSRRLPILEGINKGDRQARRSITPPQLCNGVF